MDPVVSATALTAEMLAPITGAVTENLQVLLPVGIGVMGIMIGVSLIPWAMCLRRLNTGDIKLSLIDLEPKQYMSCRQQGARVMPA